MFFSSYTNWNSLVIISEAMKKDETDMNVAMNSERPCTILESLENHVRK